MEIKEYVAVQKAMMKESIANAGRKPVLDIIVVGDNPASAAYVRGKMKDSEEVGIEGRNIHFDEDVTQERLLEEIKKLNEDPSVDGILVQLPVPSHIDEKALQLAIDPSKDVDGFHPMSLFKSCTPKGIADYLRDEGFSFKGKNAVVIGRSDIVGKPMAKILLDESCNVTVLHSKTSNEDMRFYLKHADLVVVAVGKEAFIDETYEFKESAVIVDVGINRGSDGKLHGDCVPGLRVAKQTPVPGGVGLLTRLALLKNLLEAAKL